MSKTNFSIWSNFSSDFPAALVVFLVALPLCLGIALASGAPLFSGLISGIIGGVVVGSLSRSSLSVSGPAAGLTVIVFAAIQSLPTYEAFLLAVCLAGIMQMVFSVCRAGVLGDFIPSVVIKGMLAAIGIILILKQIPHAIGYDADYEGSHSFLGNGDENTFTAILHSVTQYFLPGAVLISIPSLLFMAWWDKKQPQLTGALRYMPSPLVVVFFGVALNETFRSFVPDLAIGPEHLVAVPSISSFSEMVGELRFPDLGQIGNAAIWTTAITLAVVASIETLLSIEAIDKIDPYKRVTPTNRELFAQGVGNLACGAIGGLPVTSVIVRSSANMTAGGRTKMSTILHGLMLLLSLVTIPMLLNKIPLAALAAILISIGYKLTKLQIFREKYEMGMSYFIPFVVTVAAIVLTDLLVGIGIGLTVGIVFVLVQNFRSAITFVEDGSNYLVRLKKDFFFLHKYELKKTLHRIPNHCQVLIDITRANFIDRDNIDIINDFITNAAHRDIKVTIKASQEAQVTKYIKEPV